MRRSSGSPGSAPTIPLPACAPPAAPSSVPSAATTGSRVPPQLTVIEVARLTGAPTSIATRCAEHALYVTQQEGRVVRIDLDARPDADPATVLDMSDVITVGGEQGLLGLTFSPTGNELYLAYTNEDEDQELVRFAVGDRGVDAPSATSVLRVADVASNHNGGQLAFGVDGYLYWGMGDGGGEGDTAAHTGQDPTDLLGDILRLDVARPAGGKQYGIPPDNPFADGSKGAPEVYAYGLRNPWKFSFDRANDDLWIGDVGQNAWEEIDRVAAGEGRGANFGWSEVEGSHPFANGSNPRGATLPVYEYDHSNGRCAVIGGYVYRGSAVPALQGTYLFGDSCGGTIEGLRPGTDGRASPVEIGLGVGRLSAFGQDVSGELYAASLDGTIVRIAGA